MSIFARLVQPIAWYTAMSSELRAAWVTAIFTALQAVFVTGTLIIAFYEWSGHRHEADLKQREAASKLFFDAPVEVYQAQSAADNFLTCKTAKGQQQQSKELYQSCLKSGSYSKSWGDLDKETRPLSSFLSKAELCVRTELCDRDLAYTLFCDDARRREMVLEAYGELTKTGDIVAEQAPLWRECNEYDRTHHYALSRRTSH